jgi:hypothetical protein
MGAGGARGACRQPRQLGLADAVPVKVQRHTPTAPFLAVSGIRPAAQVSISMHHDHTSDRAERTQP